MLHILNVEGAFAVTHLHGLFASDLSILSSDFLEHSNVSHVQEQPCSVLFSGPFNGHATGAIARAPHDGRPMAFSFCQ